MIKTLVKIRVANNGVYVVTNNLKISINESIFDLLLRNREPNSIISQ